MARESLFTDNFNRANGSVGANYDHTDTNDNGDVTITSNDVAGVVANGSMISAQARNNTTTPGADQYAKIRISSAIDFQSENYKLGVMVRSAGGTSTTPCDCYGLTVAADAGGPDYTTRLFKIVSGTRTSLNAAQVAWALNDTIELEVEGTTLRAMKNGVALGGSFTQTDSALASGKFGILASGTIAIIDGDDFDGGNLTAGTTISPNTAGMSV